MAGEGVDAGRLWARIMELAEFTERERPWTRQAFSTRHAEGRHWLAERMRELKLTPSVDAAGNLLGRRAGLKALPALMIGSHSDTVAGGGRFDGIAGVIAGLEIVAALNDRGRALNHPLEVVDFLAEEPNEFGLSCIGSRGMAGALSEEMLERRNPAGTRLKDALPAVGAPATSVAAALRRDVAAFFELHIEQGPVLEHERLDVGIVTHIVGIQRLAITFKGQAAHAGTMPLKLRQDALIAAGAFVVSLRRALDAEAGGAAYVIATVGELHVLPNAPNVVPGEVRLIVDLRSDQPAALAQWAERVRALAEESARTHAVALSQFKVLSSSEPAACAAPLMAHLREAAQALGLKSRDMVSGAGHDAAFLARVAPSAMLFVPSTRGLSHCAEEWTDPAALARGVTTLLGAIERFDAAAGP